MIWAYEKNQLSLEASLFKMRSAFDIVLSTATGRKAPGTSAISKTTTKTA